MPPYTICRHCSVANPSWATLEQFVRFLFVQLSDCQNSIFCNKTFFAEDPGFKKFVVQFMIRMSKVSICIQLCFCIAVDISIQLFHTFLLPLTGFWHAFLKKCCRKQYNKCWWSCSTWNNWRTEMGQKVLALVSNHCICM